jgi:hypothetical protein
MKIRTILTLFLIITFASENCYSQNQGFSANQIYGLNPMLYNGKLYTSFIAANTIGSPFLEGPRFINGSVHIRGKEFRNLLLNYDVHTQQVVLRYKTQMKNIREIVLSKVWLKSFSLGQKHFEILTFPGMKSKIYQVIGKGHYRILYTWRKDFSLSNTYGAKNFTFSKPVRESYLDVGNKLMHYKNNRSFVALFGPENKSAINKYLRKNRIKLNKIKKSRLQAVLQLINYCNTLKGK